MSEERIIPIGFLGKDILGIPESDYKKFRQAIIDRQQQQAEIARLSAEYLLREVGQTKDGMEHER